MKHILNNIRKASFLNPGYKDFAVRIIVICILIIIYYAIQWNFLRQFLTFSLDRAFGFFGDPNIDFVRNADYNFLINGNPFIVTANCTYIDLVLIIAPLCWRFRQRMVWNLSRIVFITSLILILNVLRIWAAIHFYQSGVSWESAHHIPDIAIHIVIISTCVLLSLKADHILPFKN